MPFRRLKVFVYIRIWAILNCISVPRYTSLRPLSFLCYNKFILFTFLRRLNRLIRNWSKLFDKLIDFWFYFKKIILLINRWCNSGPVYRSSWSVFPFNDLFSLLFYLLGEISSSIIISLSISMIVWVRLSVINGNTFLFCNISKFRWIFC